MLSAILLASVISITPAPTSRDCSNIVHIGDSITVHSRKYQKTEYAKIGYPNAIISAHGSRSVFGKLPKDDLTGLEAVKYWKARTDKRACWVIALGTNDSGFFKYGNTSNRIHAVMAELRGRRVIWVNVWKGAGNGNKQNARNWNKNLVIAAKRYPEMRVLDWAKIVKTQNNWLNPDKVHYNMVGSKARAKVIAAEVNSLWGSL